MSCSPTCVATSRPVSGLRYEDLRGVNGRIVCCSLSGFGQDGPRAASGALDYVVQGLAGWMRVGGEPGSEPSRVGLSLVDYAGGYVAAIAILGGLWRSRRDGIGCDCDIALQETALSLLTYLGTWAATTGYVPPHRPDSAHPSIVPFQNFATADGWIVVACPKQELWERLCRTIDRPDLLADPRYADFAGRDRHRDPLLADLAGVFRSRDTTALGRRPRGGRCAGRPDQRDRGGARRPAGRRPRRDRRLPARTVRRGPPRPLAAPPVRPTASRRASAPAG